MCFGHAIMVTCIVIVSTVLPDMASASGVHADNGETECDDDLF